MNLTAEMIEAFSGVYLSPRYDQPQPTPEFHRECWRRYCSPHPACATAAPRNHAKSTALTHDFILALVCFRAEDYVILIGSTEEMAIEHLGDIATELRDNETLIRDFKIKEFSVDQKTDIIVECLDGHQFRIIARGAEQKIRGRKWKGKRPGTIIGDDLEDDEMVENKDRRKKFRRWFFRACKQALRDNGKIRLHGTILHIDSLLARVMKNKSWDSVRYKAHKSFNDFTQILWPEKFPASRLRAIRQEFSDEGDSGGYSQEYLNEPMDNDDKYIREEYFVPMTQEDYESFKSYGVGVDFAISQADAANKTSFTVGGKDVNNIVSIVDERLDRMDSADIIDTFFEIAAAWGREATSDLVFYVEDGVIWLSIKTALYEEMQTRDIWLTVEALKSIKDKATRGRPMQKRMKARGMRFDVKASWFQDYKDELLMFVAESDAPADDQFDSTSILIRGLTLKLVEEGDERTEEEVDFELNSRRLKGDDGRSQVTGY